LYRQPPLKRRLLLRQRRRARRLCFPRAEPQRADLLRALGQLLEGLVKAGPPPQLSTPCTVASPLLELRQLLLQREHLGVARGQVGLAAVERRLQRRRALARRCRPVALPSLRRRRPFRRREGRVVVGRGATASVVQLRLLPPRAPQLGLCRRQHRVARAQLRRQLAHLLLQRRCARVAAAVGGARHQRRVRRRERLLLRVQRALQLLVLQQQPPGVDAAGPVNRQLQVDQLLTQVRHARLGAAQVGAQLPVLGLEAVELAGGLVDGAVARRLLLLLLLLFMMMMLLFLYNTHSLDALDSCSWGGPGPGGVDPTAVREPRSCSRGARVLRAQDGAVEAVQLPAQLLQLLVRGGLRVIGMQRRRV
jgi:hypothetical protein